MLNNKKKKIFFFLKKIRPLLPRNLPSRKRDDISSLFFKSSGLVLLKEKNFK